jgi:hypothetical protein
LGVPRNSPAPGNVEGPAPNSVEGPPITHRVSSPFKILLPPANVNVKSPDAPEPVVPNQSAGDCGHGRLKSERVLAYLVAAALPAREPGRFFAISAS